jgi:hypothetical protein
MVSLVTVNIKIMKQKICSSQDSLAAMWKYFLIINLWEIIPNFIWEFVNVKSRRRGGGGTVETYEHNNLRGL